MFGLFLVLAFALLNAWASAMHGLDTCHTISRLQGGAVYVRGGEPTFIRCLFYENVAELDGGAFSINGQLPTSPCPLPAFLSFASGFLLCGTTFFCEFRMTGHV